MLRVGDWTARTGDGANRSEGSAGAAARTLSSALFVGVLVDEWCGPQGSQSTGPLRSSDQTQGPSDRDDQVDVPVPVHGLSPFLSSRIAGFDAE